MHIHCHGGPNRGLKTAIKLDEANCSIIRTGCLGAAAGVAMALDVLYAHPQVFILAVIATNKVDRKKHIDPSGNFDSFEAAKEPHGLRCAI